VGQNVYEDILNIPLIIRYPGNLQKGKRSAELVSLVDFYPTLVNLLNLKMPELKYPVQGESFAETLTKGKLMSRKYFVSESWSQATVITKDYKLGIMLDPTDFQRKFDFRSFGDQFFVRKSDSLEINNQIKDERFKSVIEKLRGFYTEFSAKIPETGKMEVISSGRKMKLKK
jgi:arylsulfatase A-like enzyme